MFFFFTYDSPRLKHISKIFFLKQLQFFIIFLQFFVQNKTKKSTTQTNNKNLIEENSKCASSTNITETSSRNRRDSLDLYEEAAAILGLTCSQTDSCKCIECQVIFIFI